MNFKWCLRQLLHAIFVSLTISILVHVIFYVEKRSLAASIRRALRNATSTLRGLPSGNVMSPPGNDKASLPGYGTPPLPVNETLPLGVVTHPDQISSVGNISSSDVRVRPGNLASPRLPFERKGWMKTVNWTQGGRLHNYPFIINPNDTCNAPEKDAGRFTLLVLIKSGPVDNLARRDAMRRTYISYAKKHNLSARFFFIMGVQGSGEEQSRIRKEAVTHGDIVLVDFKDHYYNLTVKLVMGFEWALNYCSNSDFVMSTDDDVIVDIVNLINDLKAVSRQDRDSFMIGKPCWHDSPARNERKKWFIPPELYPETTYPSFPLGHGYMMSREVLRRLYSAAKMTPALVPFDDVYCGILLKKIGVGLIDRIKWHRMHNHWKTYPDYLQIEVVPGMAQSAWMRISQHYKL